MGRLNRCEFIGNMGKEAELRYTPNGTACANFSIAVNETWKDKETGEKKERTEWIRCVAWSGLAEIIGQFTKKGSSIFVAGRMQTRKWQDKEGHDRYSTEIVVNEMEMLGGKSDGGYQPKDEDAPPESRRSANAPEPSGRQHPKPDFDFDQEIPF